MQKNVIAKAGETRGSRTALLVKLISKFPVVMTLITKFTKTEDQAISKILDFLNILCVRENSSKLGRAPTAC